MQPYRFVNPLDEAMIRLLKRAIELAKDPEGAPVIAELAKALAPPN